MEKPPEKSKWVTVYDRHGDASGELTGNKEGLLALRAAIDTALEKGEAKKPADADFDFMGVKLSELHPEDIPDAHEARNKLMSWGCLLLLIAIVVFAGIGAWGVHRWLTL